MIPRSNSHKQHKVKICYIGNPPFVSHYVSDSSFSDILPTIFCLFVCGDGLSFPTQDHEGIPHWFTGFIGTIIYWNVAESQLTALRRNRGCYYSIRQPFSHFNFTFTICVDIVRKFICHTLCMCMLVLLEKWRKK